MTDVFVIQVAIYVLCFVAIWIGAGLIVSTVASLAQSWKISRFIVSFFLLGFLTSLPEATIGGLSVLNKDPTIFVGNLLGGTIVLFLGVIPLLAMLGNGVRVLRSIDYKELILTLVVVVAPALLSADQRINQWEGVLLLLLYLTLLVFLFVKQSILSKVEKSFSQPSAKNWWRLAKVGLGILLLVLASNQVIDSTLFFADLFHISPFFISLIVVALGTNLPEISLIIRSVMSGKKDIALADYFGSASTNTLLFGVFAVVYGQSISLPNHFLQRFVFLAVGLLLFYFFSRSKETLSRREGAILFLLYVGLILFELFFLAAQN